MTKKVIIIVSSLILLCLLFAMLGYYNHDAIGDFLDSESWLSKEPFSSSISQEIKESTGGNYLATYTSDGIKFYDYNGNLTRTVALSSTKAKLYSKDAYVVVLTEDTNTIYLYKDNALLWQEKINNSIKNISVSKNGYVSVCFSPSGYKSGIAIYDQNGKNILSTYLASTYAVDTAVSNNGKIVYIAEINTSGIKPQSYIRTIDLLSSSDSNKEVSYEKFASDEIVTDIEVTNQDVLLALTDIAIYSFDGEQPTKVCEFSEQNTLYATITNLENPCVIEQTVSKTISDSTIIKKYTEEPCESMLAGVPQTVATSNDKIAIGIGSEVLVLNKDLKPVAKCVVSDNVTNIAFIKNASTLALIYKTKIEFIKL